MEEYPAITVEVLRDLCNQEIRKGFGNKKILISSDDEGNEYHGLFYGFIDENGMIHDIHSYGMFHDNVNCEDVILLG